MFSCEQCEESFTIKKNLEIHVKSKHEKRKFSCASCGYEFARKDILKKHYIKCKRKQNEKEVQDAEKDLEFIESLVDTTNAKQQ